MGYVGRGTAAQVLTEQGSSDLPNFQSLAFTSGTWTPVVKFGGGSVGVTYASGGQLGEYTQFGNVVCFSCYVLLTSKGSSSGNVTVTGFPFTQGSSGGSLGGNIFMNISSCNLVANTYNVFAAFTSGSSTMTLFASSGTTGAATGIFNDGNFTNTTEFVIQGVMFTS